MYMLQLETHTGAFAANEISGLILLDVSIEDLDYLGQSFRVNQAVSPSVSQLVNQSVSQSIS